MIADPFSTPWRVLTDTLLVLRCVGTLAVDSGIVALARRRARWS